MAARTADHLLSVDALRHSSYPITRLYPAAVAILNLFFCASFEPYLRDDTGGFYLSLFLFLEASAYSAISLAGFFTVSSEILAKSRIFPTTPADRMIFIIKGNVRRPMLLSLCATAAFFLLVVFRQTLWSALLAPLILLLFLASMEVFLSMLLLALVRRSFPPEGAVAALVLVLFISLVGSLVFHYQTLISSIPFIRWAGHGMLAASQGEPWGIITNIAWLALSTLFLLLLGKRLA